MDYLKKIIAILNVRNMNECYIYGLLFDSFTNNKDFYSIINGHLFKYLLNK